MMGEEETFRFNDAVRQRAAIIKARSLEPRYLGKDVGAGPSDWDGMVMTFETDAFAPGQKMPQGWTRYTEEYFRHYG